MQLLLLTYTFNSFYDNYLACATYREQSIPLLGFNILGGVPTQLGEFPHMAALGYPNQDQPDLEYEFDCGGSIISDMYILTAAHCVTSRNRPVVVRVGKITLHTNDDATDGITSNIAVSAPSEKPFYSPLKKKKTVKCVHIGNHFTSQLSKKSTI